MKRSKGGIDLLGGGAVSSEDVACTVQMNRTDMRLTHTNKRADNARYYVQRVRQFVSEPVTPYAVHQAWVIAAKSVAKVFSYDAALVPPVDLERVVKPSADEVRSLQTNLLGGLDGQTDPEARIATTPAFGGCGFRVEGL